MTVCEYAYLSAGINTSFLSLTDLGTGAPKEADPSAAEMLASWVALFYRYSNQDIIALLVEMPRESQPVDGSFLIQQAVSGELTVAALVAGIQETLDLWARKTSGMPEKGELPCDDSATVCISIVGGHMYPSEEVTWHPPSASALDLNISLWCQDR